MFQLGIEENKIYKQMKDLKDIIQEKLTIGSKTKVNKKNYKPLSKNELYLLIQDLIEKRGNNADLNDIDTSEITDMSDLFRYSKFDGDISAWNVSHVEIMDEMFKEAAYTGKNGDISTWDVSNVKSMSNMFEFSSYNGDLSKWDVSNVEYMDNMFSGSDFDGDISAWDVSNVISMKRMFALSPMKNKAPNWYKIKK